MRGLKGGSCFDPRRRFCGSGDGDDERPRAWLCALARGDGAKVGVTSRRGFGESTFGVDRTTGGGVCGRMATCWTGGLAGRGLQERVVGGWSAGKGALEMEPRGSGRGLGSVPVAGGPSVNDSLVRAGGETRLG